ncbi:sodium-dependent nutrient amino acid transporter 1-like isoform X1 [Bactrocera neohumeralis]|uniref:sodium-dependent nutrient amino acid transporter 1-like isoform X1 n=1 Tax=Bactrocera neohumeralis TaxID=98809 RepID=UPI0021669B94|nr:sodium-dependent nutrient amino acid transporter 1-like isoform X1 [Bactrocera neohumeralis]
MDKKNTSPIDAEVKNDRENWSGKLDFLMSCISVSVGLGNIWRFPFIAYENGGGVFLVPYIIVLFLIGKPMYYMEALLGQFASKSSVKMWSACPIFMGVGIGQAIATFAVLTYYSALIAVTIYYFIASFQSPLPWAYCREEWLNCVGSSLSNSENVSSSEKLQSSSELYFSNTVLRELDDISEGIGIPSWRLILTLLLSWIVTYLILIKGMRSLGKVAYFLAIFPYVILITLLIRAVTLEGSVDGIIYFLKPEWDKLLNMKVWKEAVVQCFFSLAVCFGPIVAFSSHNQFRYKVYRDAMIVTTLDTITSLVAGITIFGILGNLALNLNAPNISEVVRSGTGLAFISYPDAIAKFNFVPQLFAVLFFFMLFVLGIGTLAALQSALVTIICDQFKLKRFWLVSLITTIIEFGISILYVTPGGQWILNLVDYFAGTYIVFSLAVFEIVGITWFYGLRNFCDDVEFMTNRKVSIYWRLCWGIITPLLLAVIFIYSLAVMEPLTYAGWSYPSSAEIVGWILLLLGFLQFPLWGIWYLYIHKEATFRRTIKKSISPSQQWGPTDPEIYVEWLQHKESLKRLREEERNEKALSKFKQNIYYLIGISK